MKYMTDFDEREGRACDAILSMPGFELVFTLALSAEEKPAQVALKILNNILSGENRHVQVPLFPRAFGSET